MIKFLQKYCQYFLLLFIFIIVVSLFTFYLVPIYGFVPGQQTTTMSAGSWLVGLSKCYADSLLALSLTCKHVAEPEGLRTVMGLPLYLIVGLISTISNLKPPDALAVFGVACLLLGYLGAAGILRLARLPTWICLCAPIIFYAAPLLPNHRGYFSLYYGFILFPFYVFVQMCCIFALKKFYRSIWLIVLITFLLFITVAFSVFMDGYSAVMALITGGLVLIYASVSMINKRELRAFFMTCAGWLISSGLAYVCYTVYTNIKIDFPMMPIDFFRAQSVDLITMLIPTNQLFLPKVLGIAVQPWNAFAFYGDGSNVHSNYIGYVGFLCFVATVIFWRKLVRLYSGVSFALIAAGVLGLILAIGPSLKINDSRSGTRTPPITFSDYLMPEAEATLSLPTEPLYSFPIIRNMRGVYRWQLIFRLSLMVGVALIVSLIASVATPAATVSSLLLLLIAFTETLPSNSDLLMQRGRLAYSMMEQFHQDVIVPMKKHLKVGDRVLFLPSENDYLANYISPMVGIRSYNVGGDKDLARARSSWPESVLTAVSSKQLSEDNIKDILETGVADKVVFTFFSLRWSSYHWPPRPPLSKHYENFKADFEAIADSLMSDYQIDVEQYYAVIQPK